MQKYEKGWNRVGASRLVQIAHVGRSDDVLLQRSAASFEAEAPKFIRIVVGDPEVVRLLRGFTTIEDADVKRLLATMFEVVAGTLKNSGRL